MTCVESRTGRWSPEVVRHVLTLFVFIGALTLVLPSVATFGQSFKYGFVQGGFGTGPYGVGGYSVSVDRHEFRFAWNKSSPKLVIYWADRLVGIGLE
ncbi:hypothetical protein IYY11_11485 [Methylocystis sp. H62]|uniref:hypothetical protein n=1 Tax=Methylocystis sp. H62 TaxID=2785789 RepID=UPI0018C350B0|nr:hypothetical protein [Methylocystis sp. H62]MBG0793995.1 hypothetical protein [Methylocystis sp. H62]